MLRRVIPCAVLVGVAVALGAVAFSATTGIATRVLTGGLIGYQPATIPAGEPRFPWPPVPERDLIPWLFLIVPALGGFLSGLLTSKLAPEAAGPGMDSTIRAYHEEEGVIRGRVPLIKILATALTVGSGGSGGRAGPIVHIGAGIGSWIGQVLRVPPAERRVLLAVGMGAGIAALFKAPIAGTLIAAELLYVTMAIERGVVLPAAIASGTAYGVYTGILGRDPLFRAPEFPFPSVVEIGPQLLLALLMAGLARLFTFSYHGTTALTSRLTLPPALKAALGAFLAGAIGLALYGIFGRDSLPVLSWGLDSLQRALDQGGAAAAGILAVIALGKIATTCLTIGSGGSGGLFGPAIVIGGCGGGALGIVLHGLWPTLVPHPAAFVILGMGGFFSAVSKTPFAMLFIVCELTGAWRLLPASALVCVASFPISGRDTLFKAQREKPISS